MVRTYDPRQVIISLGPHVVHGYSDGTFVNIEAHGDGVSKEVGADGEVVRSINPDETATITLTVQYGSSTTPFAQQQYDMDRDTHGEGLFPVLIKDLRGGHVFSAEEAWIENTIAREFGYEASDREITIATGKAKWADSGYVRGV